MSTAKSQKPPVKVARTRSLPWLIPPPNNSHSTLISELSAVALSTIFRYFIDDGGSPWVLVQVCRDWREAGFKTHSLWARITIDLEDSHPRYINGREWCHNYLQLKKALARSGSAPLDICIEQLPDPEMSMPPSHLIYTDDVDEFFEGYDPDDWTEEGRWEIERTFLDILSLLDHKVLARLKHLSIKNQKMEKLYELEESDLLERLQMGKLVALESLTLEVISNAFLELVPSNEQTQSKDQPPTKKPPKVGLMELIITKLQPGPQLFDLMDHPFHKHLQKLNLRIGGSLYALLQFLSSCTSLHSLDLSFTGQLYEKEAKLPILPWSLKQIKLSAYGSTIHRLIPRSVVRLDIRVPQALVKEHNILATSVWELPYLKYIVAIGTRAVHIVQMLKCPALEFFHIIGSFRHKSAMDTALTAITTKANQGLCSINPPLLLLQKINVSPSPLQEFLQSMPGLTKVIYIGVAQPVRFWEVFDSTEGGTFCPNLQHLAVLLNVADGLKATKDAVNEVVKNRKKSGLRLSAKVEVCPEGYLKRSDIDFS